MSGRSLLAPTVIQTSATDCGPASLKCLLEGHGIAASYGRLREACQTDIDGSSISTLGDVASQLGLEAEEIILPADHLLLDEAHALPAVVVAKLPNGFTHFLVLWRSYRGVVQVMDPAIGRRWLPFSRLSSELFVHQTTVAASDWREWAACEEFSGALRQRIARLGISPHQYMDAAAADESWRTLAALDASVRSAEALCRNGGIRRGADAGALVRNLLVSAQLAHDIIPPAYWSVQPCERTEGEEECLKMRGAVLVRIREGAESPIPNPQSPIPNHRPAPDGDRERSAGTSSRSMENALESVSTEPRRRAHADGRRADRGRGGSDSRGPSLPRGP